MFNQMENKLMVLLLEQLIKQQNEIEALKYKLEQECKVEALRSQFYMLLNQELRTPLSVIRTSAGIIERYNDRLTDEKRQHHLSIIDGQVEHIVGLLEKLTKAYQENFHANPA